MALASVLDSGTLRSGLSGVAGRDFLSLGDFTREEILSLLALALHLKKLGRRGEPTLNGRSLAMIFQKPSTRTRVSFEVAMTQLGGTALFLSGHDLQLGRGETVSDTARVLSRYVDAVMIRTFAQSEVEEFAAAASVPVINGLTDQDHPCQVLADLLTILEVRSQGLKGLKVAFIGDGNNMAQAWLLAAAALGFALDVAAPPGYQPDAAVVRRAGDLAAVSGASLRLLADPEEAARNADVLYTDVWASMGQEAEAAKRRRDLAAYQVDERLAGLAAPDHIFLHCLPAHRGEEVSPAVIDGPHSLVFQQAENRLHAQKAVLLALLGDPGGLAGAWLDAGPED